MYLINITYFAEGIFKIEEEGHVYSLKFEQFSCLKKYDFTHSGCVFLGLRDLATASMMTIVRPNIHTYFIFRDIFKIKKRGSCV